MIYEPKHKSIVEILTATGFTDKHSGSRGWIRPVGKQPQILRDSCIVHRAGESEAAKRGDRLHALIVEGHIDLHYDRVVDGKHSMSRFGSTVQRAIKEFEEVDIHISTELSTVDVPSMS